MYHDVSGTSQTPSRDFWTSFWTLTSHNWFKRKRQVLVERFFTIAMSAGAKRTMAAQCIVPGDINQVAGRMDQKKVKKDIPGFKNPTGY